MSTRARSGPGRPSAVSLAILVALSTSVLAAQPFPQQPAPSRSATPEAHLHVGATVHKLFVQAVDDDGTLWLDMEGVSVRVRLQEVELPEAETVIGRAARRHLDRFVGQWVRFAFRGEQAHALNQSVRATSTSGLRRQPVDAYAPLVDDLLASGLARYCPAPGVVSSGLARLEEEARARRVGMWGVADSVPACAQRPADARRP